MNFSGTKYVVAFEVLFFKNRKVEIFLKLQQICTTISTELIKADLLMQMNFDINCQSFVRLSKTRVVALCKKQKT